MNEEEKNKFIALYHFLDKPQDFNLEMNYYEFRDELKNLLDLYQKEKEKNKSIEAQRLRDMCYKTDGNYVSKDKIKEIIKDLDEFDTRFYNIETLKLVTKNTLQKLLD